VKFKLDENLSPTLAELFVVAGCDGNPSYSKLSAVTPIELRHGRRA
jgi:hypothetical protein